MISVSRNSDGGQASWALLVGLMTLICSAGPTVAHAAVGTTASQGAVPNAEAKSLLASADVARCSFYKSDDKTWVAKEWGMTLHNCIEASYRFEAASNTGCGAQPFAASAKWGNRVLRLSSDQVEISDSSNANVFRELVSQHVECRDYLLSSDDGAAGSDRQDAAAVAVAKPRQAPAAAVERPQQAVPAVASAAAARTVGVGGFPQRGQVTYSGPYTMNLSRVSSRSPGRPSSGQLSVTFNVMGSQISASVGGSGLTTLAMNGTVRDGYCRLVSNRCDGTQRVHHFVGE